MHFIIQELEPSGLHKLRSKQMGQQPAELIVDELGYPILDELGFEIEEN